MEGVESRSEYKCYAGLMKHSRGCKVEECTRYEKGARMKVKDVEE